MLCHSLPALAGTYYVTNTNDAGAGSLRQAIINLNAAGDASNTISFQTTGTITLQSSLDIIGKDVEFVGASGLKLVAPSFGAGVDLDGIALDNMIEISGDFFSEIRVDAAVGPVTGLNGHFVSFYEGFHGDVHVTAGTDNAVGLYGVGFGASGITGTVLAEAGQDTAAALASDNTIIVSADISGSLIGTAGRDYAYGISGPNVQLTDISGLVSATAGRDGASGIDGTFSLLISGDVSGTVEATARTGGGATGMAAFNVDIQDISGTISATSALEDAFGIVAGNDFFLRGDLSGSVSATAGGHTAIGLYNTGGVMNGGDAATALDISGSVTAQANGLAVGIAAADAMNLNISGTVSGVDTSGGDAGYAIRSGWDDGAGGWAGVDAVDDLVQLQDGASIIGHIDLGTGADTLGLFGSGTITGDVLNVETFEIFGSGSWSVDGYVDVQDLTLGSGTLRISNSDAVTPTNEVTGDLNIGDGGTLELMIHQTASSTLDVTGDSLLDGGSVVFIPATLIASGTTFTAMTAGDIDPTAGYSAPLFTVAVSSTSVVLTKISYSAVQGLSPNAQTLADVLSPLTATAAGDLATVLTSLEDAATTEEFESNLEELTPVVQASLASQGFDLGTMFSSTVDLHLAEARSAYTALAGQGMDPDDPSTWPLLADAGDLKTLGIGSSGFSLLDDRRTSVYLRALVRRGGMSDHGDYFGYSYRSFGLTGGVDRLVRDGLAAGVNLGHAQTNSEYNDTSGSSAEVESWSLGSYATLFGDRWHADGKLSVGLNRYEVDREIGFLARTAESAYHGWLASAEASGGYSLPLGPVVLTPTGSLAFARLHQDGYEEHGAGAANLTVESQVQHSLVSGLGLNVALPVETGFGAVVPEFSAMWTHEYLTRDLGMQTTMEGNPGEVYTMISAKPERDALRLGAGVGLHSENGSSLSLRYQGDFTHHSWNHGAMLEYRIGF